MCQVKTLLLVSFNKVSSVSVRDSDAAKIACVNCDWREEKVVSEVMRNYGVHVK